MKATATVQVEGLDQNQIKKIEANLQTIASNCKPRTLEILAECAKMPKANAKVQANAFVLKTMLK